MPGRTAQPGRKTGRDVVDDAFVDMRRRLIREHHGALA